MNYHTSPLAIGLFFCFVAFVLGLSFYLARRTISSAGYYAAGGGNIHWFTNGIAFAGDYLSAASFLGICGMIASGSRDKLMTLAKQLGMAVPEDVIFLSEGNQPPR